MIPHLISRELNLLISNGRVASGSLLLEAVQRASSLLEGAYAEENKSFYLSIGAGGARIDNVESDTANFTVNSEVLSSSEKLEIENSFGYGGGIGYYLGKKNPKLDTTFITNFGANIGSPAIVKTFFDLLKKRELSSS